MSYHTDDFVVTLSTQSVNLTQNLTVHFIVDHQLKASVSISIRNGQPIVNPEVCYAQLGEYQVMLTCEGHFLHEIDGTVVLYHTGQSAYRFRLSCLNYFPIITRKCVSDAGLTTDISKVRMEVEKQLMTEMAELAKDPGWIELERTISQRKISEELV